MAGLSSVAPGRCAASCVGAAESVSGALPGSGVTAGGDGAGAGCGCCCCDCAALSFCIAFPISCCVAWSCKSRITRPVTMNHLPLLESPSAMRLDGRGGLGGQTEEGLVYERRNPTGRHRRNQWSGARNRRNDGGTRRLSPLVRD